MKRILLLVLILLLHISLIAQEIILDKKASLDQVYKDSFESEALLPMNDFGMESGYVLYQTKINTVNDNTELEFENVRDYAVVYLDGKFQGTLNNSKRKIILESIIGEHELQLYVENIGRITYGPEILDNSKGLFGEVTVDGEDLLNWKMIPLNVRDCSLNDLNFNTDNMGETPCFHKGIFELNEPQNVYLDISGWGMGEVWINNKYMGTFWDQEKQQSIQIPSADLKSGENEIVVFELKNNNQKTMKLTNKPVFK